MDKRELRIGNYVYAGKNNFVCRFESFYGMTNFESKPDNYSPIPLTEEWLLKFGFEKDDDVNQYWICSELNHLIYVYYEKSRSCFAMIYNGSQFCVIQYVHQLQNLYFALTGEELEIKETEQ